MSILTVARFWWITIPTLIARMWRAAALISFDGSYLLAFPPFAALAPPLAFAVGMLLASGRDNESFPYFFSLASTSIFIAIGMMTAALGSWALVGYAIVDALRDPKYLLANIVAWLLLAWPLILAPMSARALAIVVRSRLASTLRIPINTGFRLLLAGVLIWGWTNAFAPMLRFVYTLRGMSSPPDAGVIPIQTTGMTIVLIAVLATAVRVFLEHRAEKDSIFLAQRAEIMPRLERAPQLHLPFFLVIAIRSAILTLLAAGLFLSPFQGLLFACALFLIMSGLSSWREPYLRFIRPFLAIPIAIRFLIAVGLSTPIATNVFGDALISGTFLSLILASTLSLLLGMLIVPETIARRGKTS